MKSFEQSVGLLYAVTHTREPKALGFCRSKMLLRKVSNPTYIKSAVGQGPN